MRRLVAALVIALIVAVDVNISSAQGLAQTRADIQAKHEASIAALRESIIRLRDLRYNLCNAGQARACDLAKLNDIEMVLLDIETKYGRASQSAVSSDSEERLKKVKDAADEARGKVSDLIDLLDRLGRE